MREEVRGGECAGSCMHMDACMSSLCMCVFVQLCVCMSVSDYEWVCLWEYFVCLGMSMCARL